MMPARRTLAVFRSGGRGEGERESEEGKGEGGLHRTYWRGKRGGVECGCGDSWPDFFPK